MLNHPSQSLDSLTPRIVIKKNSIRCSYIKNPIKTPQKTNLEQNLNFSDVVWQKVNLKSFRYNYISNFYCHISSLYAHLKL